MLQASPETRLDKHALDNMFVRNGTEMAPISQFVTIRNVLGAEVAKRFNLYNTITVNVNAAEGYSTGEVQNAIKEVAEQMLPSGYGYEYGGMAREEASSGGAQTVFVYVIFYGEEVEVNVADTTSIGSMDWRELFKDPRLQALIEKGLENNTDLRTAQLRVEEAKASLLAAKLSFLPGLSFSPQGTISSFNGETSKTYTVPVTASWELDIFGKLRNAKKQAAAAYAQSEDYQQAVRSSLIANIANTYYTLLMLDEQLALSEENLVTASLYISALAALSLTTEAARSRASSSRTSIAERVSSTSSASEKLR